MGKAVEPIGDIPRVSEIAIGVLIVNWLGPISPAVHPSK
jgi:hypothetical protein